MVWGSYLPLGSERKENAAKIIKFGHYNDVRQFGIID
jgi:hypothetical protein